MIYELLIRGKADGTISGSHAIDFDNDGKPGLPRPITDKDWPSIVIGINTALLSTGDAVAEKQSKLDALKQEHVAALDSITAIIAANGTAEDVLAAAVDAKSKALKPDVQKQIDALDAQIAELTQKRDALI